MRREYLTKSLVNSIALGGDTAIIHDTEVEALSLRVGKRTRTFYVTRKLHGRLVMLKIGDAAHIAPAEARKRALAALGKMADGVDPRKQATDRKLTLRTAYEDFKANRELRPNTIKTYNMHLFTMLKDIVDEPIQDISGDDIAEIHQRMGRAGHKQFANAVMRSVRSVFNFAEGKYFDAEGRPLLTANPVSRLSKTKTWYRSTRRQTLLKPSELPGFVAALDTLDHPMAADFFRLLLLTGLRHTEAATLRWVNVDLEGGTFSVTADIAKNAQAHTLPMTDRVRRIFEDRNAAKTCEWVFPSDAKGPVVDLRKQKAKIEAAAGVRFTPHDLRRTFETVAESLDLSNYLLKKLLNHRMAGDVTAGYIIWNPTRLLTPLQRIENRMLGIDCSASTSDATAEDPRPELAH